MRCGREGMRASGGKGGEGGGWEMDRWEIKAAAGSSQEEREEWRRDNWKRKDGERGYTQRGNGQAWRGCGWGGWGGAPRQVSECKRRNTQTSVCKTESQTDRQTEYIKSGGRLAGARRTFARQRQGQRTPSARRLVCPQPHRSALAFFRLARGSCAFDHLMMLLRANCCQDWFIARGGDSPLKTPKEELPKQ